LDDVAVKLPEIWDDPSVKWPLVVGALSTSPSSTIAKRLPWSLPCCCCWYSASVTVSNVSLPSPFS
jgi:hypothetical protein